MPDKWVNASFGKGLRKIVSEGRHLDKLISFGAFQVFNATTYSSLLWLRKKSQKSYGYFEFERDLVSSRALESAIGRIDAAKFNVSDNRDLDDQVWILTNRKKAKIIEQLQKQPRRVKDVFEKIFQGIATSRDSVYFLYDCKKVGGLIEGYSKELDKRVSLEAGLLKPLLKGDQVHRFDPVISNSYVLFPYQLNDGKAITMPSEFIMSNFPEGWQYLTLCEQVIKRRENGKIAKDPDWYRYIYPKNLTMFDKVKLLSPDISLGGNFTFDAKGMFYMTTTVYGYVKAASIKESYKFWLAIMNSKLLWFYLKNTGTVLANGYFRYKPAYLNDFPLPELSSEKEQVPFVTLVDYVLYLKSHSDFDTELTSRDYVMISFFEQILDALVYELYLAEELHKSNKCFLEILMGEHLPSINSFSPNKLPDLRTVFEQLFDKEHEIRKNLFFLDTLETIRIIEGKE
jgi:hypothetical protein